MFYAAIQIRLNTGFFIYSSAYVQEFVNGHAVFDGDTSLLDNCWIVYEGRSINT